MSAARGMVCYGFSLSAARLKSKEPLRRALLRPLAGLFGSVFKSDHFGLQKQSTPCLRRADCNRGGDGRGEEWRERPRL